MACQSISGITYTCLSSTAGIANIWIANQDSLSASTVDANSDVITALAFAGGELFHNFQFETRKATSTFSEEATVTIENGSTFYTQTTTLYIPNKGSSKRHKLLLLAQNPRLLILIQDNNGTYWLSGYESGAYMATNVAAQGVAKSDQNGYLMTFIAEEPKMAYEVDSTIVSALVTTA